MAAADYYQSPSPQPGHPYSNQQPIHLEPQQPTWTPEPPKSPWERPQHVHQAPEPVYQSQQQPGYYNQGQGQGQGPNGKTTVVVVNQGRSSKEDAALGFCAGCTAACCCCGCTVM
ncbi:uncharacterized protein LY89DRAFT_738901 [Mollisia scopiformis]|uniref:Uncharacterized protein n=1 Tax=Mollisia scopiformis TaxID=149040 RepID=A0A194WU31_MOLSC|nr:uncharacterized protein LY89DRAFT_738901 [Mollisia scopiformis]KUJ11466.1 hypothetical protein LY89DRAFT_738901 [Mollisia scopiformis]